MRTKVHLKQVQVDTIIGVYAKERMQAQPLIIDAQFEINIEKSMQTDCLKDTVDYARVAEKIKTVAQESSFNLLEAFLAHLSNELTQAFSIYNLSLKVYKPYATRGLAQVSMEYSTHK